MEPLPQAPLPVAPVEVAPVAAVAMPAVEPPPAPVLAQLKHVGDDDNPQMLIQWFCPAEGIDHRPCHACRADRVAVAHDPCVVACGRTAEAVRQSSDAGACPCDIERFDSARLDPWRERRVPPGNVWAGQAVICSVWRGEEVRRRAPAWVLGCLAAACVMAI